MGVSKIAAAVLVATTLTTAPALAFNIGGLFDGRGGVIGDIANVIAPGSGDFLDGAHDGFKKANPNYGKWEENFTNSVRRDLGLKEHCEPLYNKWGEQVACH